VASGSCQVPDRKRFVIPIPFLASLQVIFTDFITLGAKVDALDENGKTPLEIASTQNKYHSDANRGFFKPQICEILLQLGADPNKTNAAGLSPLEKAGTDGEIIKILLKHGAGVNIGTNGVLMSAVNDGDVQTLKLYLENGADCNAPNTSAPLTYDSQSWRLPKIRYPLLMAALPREHGSWGTAKSTDMVNLLLDHGARVDVPVSDNELLLHYLFGNARTSALRPLIENPNIDFSIRDQNGRTVFMAACGSWIHSEAIQEWHLSSEEKKRLRAEYTPAWLLLADSELHSSSIDYLAVDNGGNHIIFWLLSKWNEEIAARLLQIPGVRALIGQKNNEGYSPLHRALQGRNMELCFQLMKDGDTDLLDLDPNGDTALHHLSRCINPTARYLLLMHKFISLGGDINARNQVGETAILAHLASGNQPDLRFDSAKHTDNFPLFIDNGADFSAAKNDGTTALHIVARRETSCGVLGKNAHGEVDYNARVFKRLIELGCDLLQEDEEGRTALDVAAAMGNDGILRLFQRKKTAE
jgi:ankyrin repeat protein